MSPYLKGLDHGFQVHFVNFDSAHAIVPAGDNK